MDLNKAMVIGRLTKDPEVRSTPSGQTVASFSIATNFVWTDQSGQKQEKVEFHNIVAWRKLAEICGQYLKKGAKVYLEGRLQTRDWVGQDGLKRYSTEIIADNMIMLDSRSAQGGGGFTPNNAVPQQQTNEPVIDSNEPVGMPPQDFNQGMAGDDDIKVENIPF